MLSDALTLGPVESRAVAGRELSSVLSIVASWVSVNRLPPAMSPGATRLAPARHGGTRLARLAALATAACATAAASAQERQESQSFIQQQRLIEQAARDERARIAPLSGLVDLQWGGWFEYYTFLIDDGVQSSRVLQRPGLAVWSRITADQGAHEAFVRMRLNFSYFNPGDQFDLQQDWEGPNFDRAWYRVNLGRALRLTNPGDPYLVSAQIGRQDVRFGTGFALDLPLDAVLLDAQLRDVRLRGLFARTIASYPNVDRSPRVADHSNRRFYGFEAAYTALDRHVPFVYALWNQDHTDERYEDWFQEYSYDTQYFGFGSRGSLAANLLYWVEGVLSEGHSFGDGDYLQRDRVRAFAWDAGLEYLFQHAMRPRVAAEYMFASGDGGRYANPTGSLGGNSLDRKDTGFVGFGFRDTGINAGLSLANLHVWRVGGSLAPLESIELLRDLEIGANAFLYQKNQRMGAVSDPTADRRNGFVGWEMDYFVNWRLASDLSWTARWGVFFPGSSFSDRDTRHTFFTGLTWSF